MRRAELVDPVGVRWTPQVHSGVGALVVAGSSGRIDETRARLIAEQGVLAESIQWFGGPGQQPGPWEVPLETFLARVDALAADCDRVVLVGTSFGAEAALVVGSLSSRVDAVVGFAPTDVVWAGVDPDGRQTSHWTLEGAPVPFVRFDEEWEPDRDPPAFRGCYVQSRTAHAEDVAAATIAVERIPEVLLVAGGDDQVWPAVDHAERIAARRTVHGLDTTVASLEDAGHRTVLPGEPVVSGGQRMLRGGTEEADQRLGEEAWAALRRVLSPSD